MVNERTFARRVARAGLASFVLAFFVLGLVVVTGVRVLADAIRARAPGIGLSAGTSRPGYRELRRIARGLSEFADAVADEMLSLCWKSRPQ